MKKTLPKTNTVLIQAIAHFDHLGTKEIKVPEWKTTIYATPLTLGEKSSLLKFADGDDADFMVRMLILKAKDKDGNSMFDLSEKPTLLTHVVPAILERVVGEIVDTKTVAEAVKN